MSDRVRWVMVAVLVAVVIGMIVWAARGTVHHRGQDVGAVRAPHAVVGTGGG